MAESILKRVAVGNRVAMRECIDTFGGLVWSLARRLAPSDAEDAMQEIFVEIWKNAGRFDPSQGSEATFVAMIARRRLIDRLRKREAEAETLAMATFAVDPKLRPSSQAPGASVTIAEEATQALRAVEALGPDQQRLLILAVDRGLTHEQIARATGLPLGTVKTNIRRGLARVRDVLKERQQLGSPSEVTAREDGVGRGART